MCLCLLRCVVLCACTCYALRPSQVNMGPMSVRRSVFLKMGMFHPSLSCPGDSGIGFDYEFSIRAWKMGFKVGLTKYNFQMRIGNSMKSGTHALKSRAHEIRSKNEERNNKAVYGMYKGYHHKKGTRVAAASLKLLKGPNPGRYFTDVKANVEYKKSLRSYAGQKAREDRFRKWQKNFARRHGNTKMIRVSRGKMSELTRRGARSSSRGKKG